MVTPLQKLDIRDNPNLVMPPKAAEQVKGAGEEWYNIDFDPAILQKGVVTQTVQVKKSKLVVTLIITY